MKAVTSAIRSSIEIGPTLVIWNTARPLGFTCTSPCCRLRVLSAILGPSSTLASARHFREQRAGVPRYLAISQVAIYGANPPKIATAIL